MLEQYIYVDGACCHQEDRGSWAVVNNTEEYSGTLEKKGIDSEYCELFAIYQALLVSKNIFNRVVILTDNSVAINLNKPIGDFEKRVRKREKRKFISRPLLKEVYNMYHSLPNVKIRQINRKKNKVADKLAKKTLRGNKDD